MRPKLYLASKLFRAEGWQNFKHKFPEFDVISTWHEDPVQQLLGNENNENRRACLIGWTKNRTQVLAADALLAYGFKNDPLNGTLIEIGLAMSMLKPIYLVGDYPWGTWKFMSNVQCFKIIKPAIEALQKDFKTNDPTEV